MVNIYQDEMKNEEMEKKNKLKNEIAQVREELENKLKKREDEIKLRKRKMFYAQLFIALLALSGTIVGQVIAYKIIKKRDTLENRVISLNKSLIDAVKLIDEIGNEIKERQEMAAKLENDIKLSKELVALDKNKVEAIAQVLSVEINKGAWRNIINSIIMNIIFFTLGAIITFIISRYFYKKANYKTIVNEVLLELDKKVDL